ncbi:glucokinase [Actinobaculum suis]|uniref:ROK family glucokinase n=1 Tax=Actinobaculum suis TaxID=1657 RepID=UPI00066FDB6D|nr:ROK family glucokinase [Actinobaculum suis]KMY22923.1 glucokinase [Actinobaculum suis]
MSLSIGVDVGGTKIAAGLVDESGRIIERVRRETLAGDREAIAQAVAASILDFADSGAQHVGIGAAGYVSADRSTVIFAPNLSWVNEPLGQEVAAIAGVDVIVENDANAAAWGEYKFGAAAGASSAVAVTIGTGVGGGIIANGKLVRGNSGFGGEIGHMRLATEGPICGCGKPGCWEAFASGTALTRYAVERTAADPESGAAILAHGNGKATGLAVTAAAQAGDPMALDIFRTVARYTAIGVSNLISLLDPQVVVLAGGVSEAGSLLLDPVLEQLPQYLSASDHRPPTPIRLATLGNDAGIIGAADLARQAA